MSNQPLLFPEAQAERDRLIDLLFSEPINTAAFEHEGATKAQIEVAIKADRFRLLIAIRAGKPFAAVVDEIDSGGGQA